MIKSKIQQFFRTYFYFSSGERKGALVFVLLIILIAVFPYLYQTAFPNQIPQLDVWSPQIVVEENSTPDTAENKPSANIYHNTQEQLSEDLMVDPNKATDDEWKKLGLRNWQIKNIRKYQSKGGMFRSVEDVSKIYGVSDEQYRAIASHLFVESVQINDKPSESDKRKTFRRVELNTADSNELKSLYGIGSKMASRIIEYRDKLGGYVSLNQLTEIWGFNEDLLYELDVKCYVDTARIQKIYINKISQPELSKHPYVKIRLSKVIVNYRMQHGPYRQPADLKKTDVVHDSTIQKLTPYLDFSVQ